MFRYDNNAQTSDVTGVSRVNRLGSLNPEEIESIDVIKGPSAAALYGTAAANGVLVIKTKRGQAGQTRLQVFAEAGLVSQPYRSEFPSNYQSWGRAIVNGAPTGASRACAIYQAAASLCTLDSLTSYNPWTASETDPFQSQPRSNIGAQLSGGTERLRYFLSANHEDETGPYVMPDYEIRRITEERGLGPRPREIKPNNLKQNSFRGNFGLGITPTLNLDISTGYARRDLYRPFEGTYFGGMTFQFLTGPGYKNATNGLAREFVGDIFGLEDYIRDDRFTGSASLNWQPRTWLTGRAVAGIDQDNSYGSETQRNGEATRTLVWGPAGREGGKYYDRSNNARYSLDLGATATWQLRPSIGTRTSVGAQYFRDALYQSQGQGYALPPGATTTNSASKSVQSYEFTTENATYGAFVEEQLTWRDRVYLTGGVRTDQNSAFGRNVGTTIYPRASLSYVISDEGWFPRIPTVDRLRLRAAFGRAGVQPTALAALQYLGAAAYPTGLGVDQPALRLSSVGNAKLKPEVTTEYEAGLDIGFLRERLNFEATLYRKISRDALYQMPLPPSYGTSIGSNNPTQWRNLARVENRGFELVADALVIDTRPVSWNVRVNGSILRNKLVDAGGIALPNAPGTHNEVGYPLFGQWDRRITSYSDTNGDGILTDNEIEVSPNIEYAGSSFPLREGGLTNTLGFFGNALTVSALFDYRGDFVKRFRYEEWRCQSAKNCRAISDPSAPLADQAAAVAVNSSSKRTFWGYLVPNDFVKFRELSVTYTVPRSLTRRFLSDRGATIVVSGRNLGYLMNKYPGIDPESNNSVSNSGGGNMELTATPPLRYWIARVNLSF